jgi:hypothetical protein
MTILVVCPSCKRRLHVPEKLAGRRVTCTRCGEAVRAPLAEEPKQEAASFTASPRASEAAIAAEAPLSSRLGIAALALGLLAILVVCVPVLGYASLGLSGLGLMLALSGFYCARKDGVRRFHSPAGVPGMHPLGRPDLNFPLGGMLVCLLAAALVLLPFLFR